MLENHLTALYGELGIVESPELGEDQSFLIALNAKRPLKVKELKPGLLFSAQICSCPEEKREEIFIELMNANFLGQGTGRSRLGIDDAAKQIVLTLFIPDDVSYRDFKEDMEEFANYVDYWSDTLGTKAA